ncbi:MAG: aminoacetone oxidase family FAD-binding enzyme [Clostridia bacterium]|nr:aminoacetone oxidase family FAD-binding enzyme [Clostridia bacterium]
MEKYDVIIVGGGASGLMCAITTKAKKVLLLDASDRLGKKILVTGNGKCNITNDSIATNYYNDDKVSEYFAKFNNLQTIKLFENIGLFTYSDEEGRRYPVSNSANSVLDIILAKLRDKDNVQVMTSCNIQSINKSKGVFQLKTDKGELLADKVVLATGGNSATKYLENLGMKYVGFTPSLMGLKTTKNKGLAGVRVSNVKVSFNEFEEVGEVLFKEDGVSGIVIFNLSASLARNGIRQGRIFLDFLPNMPLNTLKSALKASIEGNSNYSPIEILEGLLHKSLAKNILDTLGIKNLKDFDLNNVANLIKQYPVNFVGYSDNNQVHSGGVDLKDLDNNLQSKDVANLYVIGELVNVDGVCGGYNLQWAWTSGHIVGEAL